MHLSELLPLLFMLGLAGLTVYLKRRWDRAVRDRAQRLLEIAGDDDARAVRTGVETQRDHRDDEPYRVTWASLDLSAPWEDLSCALGGDASPGEERALVASVSAPACREALQERALQAALRRFLTAPGERSIRGGVVRVERIGFPDDPWSLVGLKTEVGDVQRALARRRGDEVSAATSRRLAQALSTSPRP